MIHRSQINKKGGILRVVRGSLEEVETSSTSRVILCGIEIERLHSIIDSLYSKISVLEQAYEEEIIKIKEEFRIMNEAQEGERKVINNQIKTLQQIIADQEYTIKARSARVLNSKNKCLKKTLSIRKV